MRKKDFFYQRSIRPQKRLLEQENRVVYVPSHGHEASDSERAGRSWYPGSEMGNVYLSGIDYTISDYRDRKEWADRLAFPTFLDWLAFYLEGNSLD